LGCHSFGQDVIWGPQDDADSIATVHAALDAGINFFDTAEMYGDGYSEEVLGRALADRRHEAVIATKALPQNLSRESLRQSCERSLKHLNTDVIDLYQIHFPNPSIPIEETLSTMSDLQQEGKIRAIGVSNFGVRDLTTALTVTRVDTNQLPYNLLFRAIEFEILPKCTEANVSVLTYSSMMLGMLTGKYTSPDQVPAGRSRSRHFSCDRPMSRHGQQGFETETFATIEAIRTICEEIGQPMARVSLAWLLQQRGITSVLVGGRRPDQILETATAADLELPPEVIKRLAQATDELKQLLGPNADLVESDEGNRIR
jgi:aryl-alcohol dehydrogenase-like predicted oxidoreductase